MCVAVVVLQCDRSYGGEGVSHERIRRCKRRNRALKKSMALIIVRDVVSLLEVHTQSSLSIPMSASRRSTQYPQIQNRKCQTQNTTAIHISAQIQHKLTDQLHTTTILTLRWARIIRIALRIVVVVHERVHHLLHPADGYIDDASGLLEVARDHGVHLFGGVHAVPGAVEGVLFCAGCQYSRSLRRVVDDDLPPAAFHMLIAFPAVRRLGQ